jgi:hypothetical protein
MTREEFRQLTTDVQMRQSQLDNVEVDAARGSLSQPLRTAPGAECCCPGRMS